MSDVLKNIGVAFLEAFGLEHYLSFTGYALLAFYILAGLAILVGLYLIAWRRLEHYAKEMDRFVVELWSREEYEIREQKIEGELKRLRLEKLKKRYQDRIDQARRKRNVILNWVPFMKWLYKRSKGKDAPMYILPD